jgi:hypothetical protein
MTYRERSVSQRLDGLIAWTGIPRLAARRIKPRRQRWSSVLVIVLASLVLLFCWTTDSSWKMSIALGLMGSFGAVAVAIREFGPLRTKALAETEDERENLWGSRSEMVGFAVVAIVAMIGVFGAALALLFFSLRNMTVTGSTKIDALPIAIGLIGFGQYLLLLLMVVPTLHASWTLPSPIEDEEPINARARFGRKGVSPR